MGTLQRIKEFIDLKGITIKKFEESVGFSNGAFSSQLKNNKTIGVDKLENILNTYSEINPRWLLTGEGNMLLDFSLGITGGEEPATDKEFNDIAYEVNLLRKLAISNPEISEVYYSYNSINDTLMLIHSYTEEYSMHKKMLDYLTIYKNKQITIRELQEKFRIEFNELKELHNILLPYKNIIFEIKNALSKFDDEHEGFFSFDGSGL